jgi:hypothetical protein
MSFASLCPRGATSVPAGFGATVDFCCDAARWSDATLTIAANKRIENESFA